MQTVALPEVSHYTYRVTWSAEDGEFLATCAEFPSLSWLASSQIEALQGLQDLLHEVLADMESRCRSRSLSVATQAGSTSVSERACTATWLPTPPRMA
jgi:predicted RNase H-like HicB family nuclease